MKKSYEEPRVQLMQLALTDLIATSSEVKEPDCDLGFDIFD